MPGMSLQGAVTLTPAAVAQVRRLMEREGVAGLRLSLRKGGCAGMEYRMDVAHEAEPGDEAIEQDGARVLIAPGAQMFLLGTEIDYATDLLESGFRFSNPNVSDACGCGESVRFNGTLRAG